jgi:hypothetical protein
MIGQFHGAARFTSGPAARATCCGQQDAEFGPAAARAALRDLTLMWSTGNLRNMIWNVITSIATVISMIAFIITALYIRAELKSLEQDRYITVTNEIFSVWQSRDFMEAQLWLLHKMQETTWQTFVAAHRGDTGEIAFHRVGSFYDRVGTLIRMGLIGEKEILSTMGGYAIAIWDKIEPLVREARRIENSVMFDDFERMLPACYECYVPALGHGARVTPFSLTQPVPVVSVSDLKRRIGRKESITILDVRQPANFDADARLIPGSVHIAPGEIETRFAELPIDREVIALCA